jgi:perosamine synthetase
LLLTSTLVKSQLNQQLTTLTHRKFASLTSSGSTAIIIALNSANLEKGTEVIMPAICCPAVLCAIQWAGFIPVLADINFNDFSLDALSVAKVITPKTSAIVAVHNYGHYCQIDSLVSIAKQHNLLLIEDACLAMGGSYQKMPLGSFGDISIVSFGYDKIVTANYGGAILTNDATIYENAERLIKSNDFFNFDNKRNTEIVSITEQVNSLSETLASRKTNVNLCRAMLTNTQILQPKISDEGIYWRYPVLIPNKRQELIEAASKHGIIIASHYKSLAVFFTGVYCPNAENFSERVINLFIRPATPKTQLTQTINFINGFYQSNEY